MDGVAVVARSWTRWRRIGDSKGSNAGGGRGDANAVGRQARRGGNKLRGSGGGTYWTIVAAESMADAAGIVTKEERTQTTFES